MNTNLKRAFKGLLSIMFVILLVGCSKTKQNTIGFLHPTKDIIRFTIESKAFKDYCKPQGYDVIIKGAQNDEALQIEQARELIAQDVDLLVIIAVNINTAAAIVREAHENNIPVMAYNRLIENCEVDFFMGSNGDQIGKIMVDALVEKSGGGNFVILGGDKFDKNGLDLQKSAEKYLQPYIDQEKVNIVYKTYIEQWMPSIAKYEFEKIISLYGTDIDAVLAGSDGMAEAVISVLKEHDLQGKVAISGQDAEIRACKAILAGNQTVTVYHPLKEIAHKGAEIAIDMINNKNLKKYINSSEFNGLIDVPTHRVNSIGVNKDNLQEVLVDSKFYTVDQVYN
ncbi:substrate-binding domain-containing protein [Saccharicrinis aurantiacus]|uniref:substrate-binding domain-containing protein n=1 Tax=Saccharicrinis aurantiacus TaxID=1849719 RepID=UPI00248F6CD5|nr:substrate-binding domain-containing protein [Saccharicrinis aurantiacus]